MFEFCIMFDACPLVFAFVYNTKQCKKMPNGGRLWF